MRASAIRCFVFAAVPCAASAAWGQTAVLDVSSLAPPPNVFGTASATPIDLDGDTVDDAIGVSIDGSAFGGLTFNPAASPANPTAGDDLIRLTARLNAMPSDPGSTLSVTLTQPPSQPDIEGTPIVSEIFTYTFAVDDFRSDGTIFFDVPVDDFASYIGIDVSGGGPVPVVPTDSANNGTPQFNSGLTGVGLFNPIPVPPATASQTIELDVVSVEVVPAFPNGRFVLSGGDAVPDSSLLIADAQINFTSGSLAGDSVRATSFTDSSEVNVYAGATVGNAFQNIGAVTVNILGGDVGDGLAIDSGGTANVQAGSVGNDVFVLFGGVVNVAGGSVGDRLETRSGGTVNVSRGVLGDNLDIQSGGVVSVTGGTVGTGINVDLGATLNISGRRRGLHRQRWRTDDLRRRRGLCEQHRDPRDLRRRRRGGVCFGRRSDRQPLRGAGTLVRSRKCALIEGTAWCARPPFRGAGRPTV